VTDQPTDTPDASESEASNDDATEAPANGEAADASEPSVDELKDQIEAIREERDEINERLLRTAAELQNYRRRTDREKRKRYEAGREEVLRAMLDVLDDFERSMDAAESLEAATDPAEAYESLKGGVEMVLQKFRDELGKLGVERIDAEGKPFDETLHEAMMRQPTDEVEPGTVVNEVRTGYTLGDRVLRHSRVVVATEPDADDA
jgi:molecular chaperone GrpE